MPHEVVPAHIDERRLEGEAAATYVQRLALGKARAVARQHPGRVVLGADTTVALDGAVLEKPTGLADAERMLRLLAGRTHDVHTGIAVVCEERELLHVETTAVRFTHIPEYELSAYLATGDSLDKAGAYGIQGYAARWVERIEGDFSSVVGLPLAPAVRLLRELGAA